MLTHANISLFGLSGLSGAEQASSRSLPWQAVLLHTSQTQTTRAVHKIPSHAVFFFFLWMREIVIGAEPTLIFQATSQDLSIAALETELERHNVPFWRKQAQQWNCLQKGGDTVLCSALPRFCCATPSQVRLGNVTHGQPWSRDIVADTEGVMDFWAAERCSEFYIWWYFLESWPSSQDSMLKIKRCQSTKLYLSHLTESIEN